MTKTQPVCERCKSPNVGLDASARWDYQSQRWVLAGTQDNGFCRTCGADEIDFEEIEVDESTFDPGQREPCAGHKFECTGTAYGGDDEQFNGEGRSYCIYCGADGDA